MIVSKEDLKRYIKIQEYLEFLYNLYYEKRNLPFYLNKIIKHKIRSEYRRTFKHKKIMKNRTLNYFVTQSKKVYDMIKGIKMNEKTLTFDNLVSLDKFIYYCSSRFRKYTKIYQESSNKIENESTNKMHKDSLKMLETLYCVDCKLEIKTKMKEYHLKGKKHIKNKNKEIFMYIDGDRNELIKKGFEIINNIKKE
jgi:hypothetical protein